MNLYFNEYNLLMGSGGISYLPFVSGILCANAKKISRLKKEVNFAKFLFLIFILLFNFFNCSNAKAAEISEGKKL